MCIKDLSSAGTETSSITLEWAMILLLHHPQVQDQCYTEINQVVGKDRAPEWRDHAKMPYLEATIMEVLRYIGLVPFSVAHGLAHDAILRGNFESVHTTLFRLDDLN
jgi:cytochrome P450